MWLKDCFPCGMLCSVSANGKISKHEAGELSDVPHPTLCDLSINGKFSALCSNLWFIMYNGHILNKDVKSAYRFTCASDGLQCSDSAPTAKYQHCELGCIEAHERCLALVITITHSVGICQIITIVLGRGQQQGKEGTQLPPTSSNASTGSTSTSSITHISTTDANPVTTRGDHHQQQQHPLPAPTATTPLAPLAPTMIWGGVRPLNATTP